MKIPPVKGTRDFYPPLMAVRNFIVDGWKAASLRNGFAEYDGPIFEYLKMYQIKSGDEISEQLFGLTDRGGRELAIRPEITPTLARMVNQQINSLARPIKWFSVPRLCRAERPQKGRLREFFQWNIDIIDVADVIADAEVIYTAVDYMRQVGLGVEDIVVKISSRRMLAELLLAIGIEDDRLDSIYAILDKKSKIPAEAFEQMLSEKIEDGDKCKKVLSLMSADSIEAIGQVVVLEQKAQEAVAELKRLFEIIEAMGISDYCRFDVTIVRGLAYYTGIVFEVYDKASELRAIGGGGRYDNLLKQFGGPAITATGFGMGDCVLGILLEEKGLLQNAVDAQSVDYFIACVDSELLQNVYRIVAKLREKGYSANFSYKSVGLGKQLKEASAKGAANCIIIGEEYEKNELVIKDMQSGQQELVGIEAFFSGLNQKV